MPSVPVTLFMSCGDDDELVHCAIMDRNALPMMVETAHLTLVTGRVSRSLATPRSIPTLLNGRFTFSPASVSYLLVFLNATCRFWVKRRLHSTSILSRTADTKGSK